jgi:hypothetical protein
MVRAGVGGANQFAAGRRRGGFGELLQRVGDVSRDRDEPNGAPGAFGAMPGPAAIDEPSAR